MWCRVKTENTAEYEEHQIFDRTSYEYQLVVNGTDAKYISQNDSDRINY